MLFNYQGVYCIYVWRPSASVPIGSVILQILALLRCEGTRRRILIERLEALDCVHGLRSADVLCSMTCAQPALQRLPASPFSEVRCKSSPTGLRLGPSPSSQVRYRSSPTAATEHHVS